jgi:NAD+ kinase
VIRLGVVGHRGYEGLPGVLATLRRLAPTLDVALSFENSLCETAGDGSVLLVPEEVDALLTLGGDGTLLRADRMEEALRRFVAGEHVVEPRMTLDARVRDPLGVERAQWRALNDVVLHKGGFARVVTMRVQANGETVARYAADGIVFATPTGSTAYNLSAGGPVVFPTLETILVTPVSAHTLAIRPLVLPPTSEVIVQAEDGPDELLVTVDGQVGATFGIGEALVVQRSPFPVSIVRFQEGSFFATMREKLQWGGLLDRDEVSRC